MDRQTQCIIFPRRLFIVYIIHWVLMLVAVPVVSLIENDAVFTVYCLTAFSSTILLALLPPARNILMRAGTFKKTDTLNKLPRVPCAGSELVHRVAKGVVIPCAILFLIGLFLLREGGPSASGGVYWIHNHGSVIREITQAEYLRLRIVERALFCSGLAVIRSGLMSELCYADAIV